MTLAKASVKRLLCTLSLHCSEYALTVGFCQVEKA